MFYFPCQEFFPFKYEWEHEALSKEINRIGTRSWTSSLSPASGYYKFHIVCIEISINLSGYAILFVLVNVQLVENDKLRNGNREALTALRKKARTTTSSVPSPFGSIMKGVSRPLVQEVCTTCGNHDSFNQTWTMFPGTDLFVGIPFHAAHTILETGYFYSILPYAPLTDNKINNDKISMKKISVNVCFC